MNDEDRVMEAALELDDHQGGEVLSYLASVRGGLTG